MSKISKRTREQAALICAVAASADTERPWTLQLQYDLGSSRVAGNLAAEARRYATEVYGSRSQESDAEAEALLRTGWSP